MIVRLSSGTRSRSGRSILSRSCSVLSPGHSNNKEGHSHTTKPRHNYLTTAAAPPSNPIVSPSRYNYTSSLSHHHHRWFSTSQGDSPTDDDEPTDDEPPSDEPFSDDTPSDDALPDDPPSSDPSSSSEPPPSPPHTQHQFHNPSVVGMLRPQDIVTNLDRHIVGQDRAKRSVAIAMRNRWRRKLLPDELRMEVTPRNVLMIGPTGCGKTEVARRMAALSDAPFIKVEATKFTEVGYHGRDVDQIVRDLMDISMNLTKKRRTEQFRAAARESVEDRILDLLTGSPPSDDPKTTPDRSAPSERRSSSSRDSFRSLLQQGSLDDQEVEVDVPVGLGTDKTAAPAGGPAGGIFTLGGEAGNPNLAAMTDFLSRMTAAQGGGKKGGGGGGGGPPSERKKMSIAEARGVILDMELERMLEGVDIKKEAIESVEESGIVFIDEIDKICSSRDFSSKSADASAEGVQRDLLPLVEGTTISTKYGNVNTDYVLFIASGAFHSVKPSDMLPELQGRLPIRVELQGLTEDDLYKILTEPVANLLRQQIELIATEGVKLHFEDDAVREIARMAALLNRTVENIGARRLHTVIERIMEILSFEAAEMEDGAVITVDKALVEERLSDVLVESDLSRYIL